MENINENIEIIADLNDKPMGKYGIRKCLTKTIQDNGHIVYSIREYTPRPLYGEVKRYVPGRGVNVSEQNLKDICEQYRYKLYDTIHAKEYHEQFLKDWEEEQNKSDEEIAKEESELEERVQREIDSYTDEELNKMERDYQEDYENEDPDIDGDFEYELGCEFIAPYPSFRNDDGEDVVLSVMSWHGKKGMNDIRVWTHKINSRGFSEFYPEIDKGLQLDDFEIERLCQEIENLYPEVREKNKDYIEEGKEETFDTIIPDFTYKEREIIVSVLGAYIDRQLQIGLIKGNRGSTIGEYEDHNEFEILHELKRKVSKNERLTDEDMELIRRVLNDRIISDRKQVEEQRYSNNEEEYEACLDINDYIENMLRERDRLIDPKLTDHDITQVSLSKGECQVLIKILNIIKGELYSEENNNEKQKYLAQLIDEFVMDDIKERNKYRVQFGETYKIDPGKHFFEDLIDALTKACDELKSIEVMYYG